jgi:hypothetical protein
MTISERDTGIKVVLTRAQTVEIFFERVASINKAFRMRSFNEIWPKNEQIFHLFR